MNTLAEVPVIHALGWALCHSLWQGTLLGLLAAGVLRAARNRAPVFRYRVAYAALVIILFVFLGTLLWLLPGEDPSQLREGLMQPVFAGAGSTATRWLQIRLLLTPWMPWLIGAWFLGLGFHLLKLAGGLIWLYGPCLGGAESAPPIWQRRMDALRRQAGIRTSVRLRVSRQVDSFLVLGWLKPVVLVPAGALLALPPEALEALLAHELAHIRRGDFLANLAQTFAESLLFFNPAVRWLSRHIRQERELCCDDAAVLACGDPILYASALVGLEELRTQPHLIPDLALAASGGKLMSRIERLLLPPIHRDLARPWAALLPLLLVAASLGATTLSMTTQHGPKASAVGRTAESEPVDLSFKQIRVKHQPEAPAYPPDAKAQRIQGTVVVVLTIDPQGKVMDARAISGPEELRACAVGYARAWEFEPARVKGTAVKARFKLTMPFRLR